LENGIWTNFARKPFDFIRDLLFFVNVWLIVLPIQHNKSAITTVQLVNAARILSPQDTQQHRLWTNKRGEMMEDHFDRMLATDGLVGRGAKGDGRSTAPARDSGASQQYIRADKFQGRKDGYVFQMGPHGLGYYYDQYQRQSKQSVAPGDASLV
jgi:hypothetical protein